LTFVFQERHQMGELDVIPVVYVLSPGPVTEPVQQRGIGAFRELRLAALVAKVNKKVFDQCLQPADLPGKNAMRRRCSVRSAIQPGCDQLTWAVDVCQTKPHGGSSPFRPKTRRCGRFGAGGFSRDSISLYNLQLAL
jgi:hypothetical protein